MTDKVQYVDITKIHWNDRARVDLGDIESLTESIKEKGVLQPITIYSDFEGLAGFRRYTAATAAGLSKIPALLRDRKGIEDTEIDMLEIELIENVFRKDFEWQEEVKLVAKIDALCRSKNIDWSVRKTAKLLGHSHPMNVSRSLQLADAFQHMPELANLKTQDDAMKVVRKLQEGIVVQELRKRQTEGISRGLLDMLKVADKNYCIGDAFKGMAEWTSNGAVAFQEIDPPYAIDLNEQKKQDSSGHIVQSYKEVPLDKYPEFLKRIAMESYRIGGRNSWMIFWFGPTHHDLVFSTLTKAGWHVDEIPAIWSKGYGQTNAPEFYLARSYEPFFICRKGNPVLVKRGRSNVFNFTPVAGAKKYHPTERPLDLMQEILDVFTLPNQVVVVPFAGSGVTLRACYTRGLLCKGWDENPEYKDKFMLAVEEDTKNLDAILDKDDE